jgi:hypothetical protein
VSETDSSLLSVSADGTDTFVFTRQTLVPQDLTGPTVKLYTARSEGGFFILPSQQPCKASDECRGAGSVPAPPATIRTITGEDGQVSEPEGGSCSASRHLRRARTLSRRAKSLRRGAVKSSNGAAKSKQLRRAKSMARAAKRERDAAQKCRRVNKRSARRAGK